MSNDREILNKLDALQSKINALEKKEYATGKKLQVNGVPVAFGSGVSPYLSLHGLRGFWPMSVVNETPLIIDMSGQDRHLTRATVTINATTSVSPYIPYAAFTSDRYLHRADEAGLDILGTEAIIASASRGLTIGTWIRASASPPSGDLGIISKYNTSGNQRGYLLYRQSSSGQYRFIVSTDGSATVGQTASIAFVEEEWTFIAGRYNTSNSIDFYQNDTKATNTTSIPASIFNSSARFEIGSHGNGASATTWPHQQAFAFVCAASLSDEVIEALYQTTRGLFGV